MSKKYSVGIDLGTSNSCVSIMEAGQPKVLITKQGARTMPSIVAFNKNGEKIVGQPAKAQQITNPENTIYSAKRFIGRTHNEVPEREKKVSYKLTGSGDELVKIVVNEKEMVPQEISAAVLSELKQIAEDYLGEKVQSAVITVPAYFESNRKQATKEAGEIAGFKVERIIAEPTAAALAYGIDKLNRDMKIAVFDLGGGTFDVSILHVADGVFETLATNGDSLLGGDNWDEALVDYIADEFKKKEGIDLRNDPMALQRIREAAEKTKCELSTAQESEINCPFITANSSGPKHLQLKITRSKFEQITESLFNRIVSPCEKALSDSGLTMAQIDEVILVGGSTRMPKAQEIAKKIFGKDPNKSVNPDEAVAIGAAIQASILSGETKDILLLDVTPLTLSIETMGGIATPMIDKNTTIPCSKSQVYSTAQDNQGSVTISVGQGERQFMKDNKVLGRFDLTEIEKAPRGVPQIEVTFSLDANGILSVSAKDKKTEKQQKIEIKGSSGLSKEDIERMKNQADLAKEEDAKKKEFVEAKNQAENTIYQVDKFTEENKDKLSEQQKKSLDEAKIKVLEAQNKEEKDTLVSASSELFALFVGIQQELNKSEVPSEPQAETKAE